MTREGPVESLSAVTLATADMAESFAFYIALGFRLRYGGRDATFTSFEVGDGYLNLQLVEGSRVEKVWGRAIFWVDDVDAMYDRARAAGFTPVQTPDRCHAVGPSGVTDCAISQSTTSVCAWWSERPRSSPSV